MLFEASIVALAGGCLCLDRVFLQFMVSRPVVSGTLIGFLLSDPYTGLVSGALVELLWIDRSPIGTVVPPNETIASIVIAAAVIIAGKSLGAVTRELIALGIIILLPTAILCQLIDTWTIRENDKISKKAVERASYGDIDGVSRLHVKSLARTYLVNTVFIFAALLVGSYAVAGIYPLIPPALTRALSYVYFFLPVLGVAVALNTIHLRGTIPLFSGVFLIMAAVFEVVWRI